MELIKQHYNCSLCKKDDTRQLLEKQGFAIVQCRHCGFVYVNPRLHNDQLATIYQHNYFHNRDYGYTDYEQEKRLRVKNFERWLKDAEVFLPSRTGTVSLDVGCAAGYCLDVMNTRGWQAEGLELDEEVFGRLQQQGYKVSRHHLEDFEPGKKYTLISLFDVIEHIPDPGKAFARLHHLLEDDGIIVMVTPNHDSLQRKITGKRWFQYKPIEHIQYFTKTTLTAFAEENGLRVVHTQRCGQYADGEFLLNRLKYYHFPFLYKCTNWLFNLLGLQKRSFYTDTGSLFLVLKKAAQG